MRASGGLRAPLRTGSAGGGRGSLRAGGLRAAARGPGALWCSKRGRTLPARTAERPRPSGPAAGRAPARACANCVPAGTTAAPASSARRAQGGGAPEPWESPQGTGEPLGRGPEGPSRDPAGPYPPAAGGGRAQRDPGAPPASRACPGLPCARGGATPEQSLSVGFWVLLQTHSKSRSWDLFASKNASSTWRVAGCTAGRWPRTHGTIERSKRNPTVHLPSFKFKSKPCEVSCDILKFWVVTLNVENVASKLRCAVKVHTRFTFLVHK